MCIATATLSRNRRRVEPDEDGVLYCLPALETTWAIPNGYIQAAGLLVWKVTNEFFGVYRGLSTGWEFIAGRQWRACYLTPLPVFIPFGDMAITEFAVKRNRHTTVDFNSMNRATLVDGLQTAFPAYLRYRRRTPQEVIKPSLMRAVA